MIGWFKRLFGGKPAKEPATEPATPKPPPGRPTRPPHPHSKFDAAQTWPGNAGLWGGADDVSPAVENSLAVRQVLRRRSRYTCMNSGYAGGLAKRLADDTIGTGPRLQVLLENPAHNAWLEAAWNLWASGEGVDPRRSVRLAGKLWLMALARPRDGESIGLQTTNEGLISPVKLDLLVVETDQVTTPWGAAAPGAVDGVELDGAGRPAFWHVLREHPGDQPWAGGEYQRVPAARVLHWFRPTRAGQVRGVPEISASLPLYAQLRDWTEATLSAAKSAAKFSGLLVPPKDWPVDPNAPAVVAAPNDYVEVEEGTLAVVPPGHEMKQFEAEHPTAEYPSFKQELLKEGGSAVNAPYNVAANDSSPYNYSSAQMDTNRYYGAIDVVRGGGTEQVLDPLFWAFLEELRLVPGYLTFDLPEAVPHVWHFPGRRAIDPLKESAADTERLGNCTTTLARIYAEKGLDWEAELRQLAKEVALCGKLGLVHPAAKVMGVSAAPEPAPADGGDGAGDNPDDTGEEPAAFRNGHARNGRCRR